jgi:hypothetical protein
MTKRRKKMQLKLYNVAALPTLLYECEFWTIKSRINRIESVEMRYLRTSEVYVRLNHAEDESVTK